MNPSILKKSIEVSFALFDKSRGNLDQRFFVVCCAYYKNRLIVIETNSNKTDPNNLRNPLVCRNTGEIVKKNRSCAEWNTIKRIKNTTHIPFSKISLVNVRVTKNNRIGLSKCCGSCSNLIKYIKPKDVYYTLDSSREAAIFEKY